MKKTLLTAAIGLLGALAVVEAPQAQTAVGKASPPAVAASETARRDEFMAKAEEEIARAKTRLAELQKKATEAKDQAKARLNQQIAALQKDLKAAEQKLAELKKANVARWNKFEDDLRAALARLRKTFEKATG